jgi:hypothetical protein
MGEPPIALGILRARGSICDLRFQHCKSRLSENILQRTKPVNVFDRCSFPAKDVALRHDLSGRLRKNERN